MQCVLPGGRVLRRVLRRGSKKGLSRRHLEGRNTPIREYDPVGVRPIRPFRWGSSRTFSGAKGWFDSTFWGSIEPFLGVGQNLLEVRWNLFFFGAVADFSAQPDTSLKMFQRKTKGQQQKGKIVS